MAQETEVLYQVESYQRRKKTKKQFYAPSLNTEDYDVSIKCKGEQSMRNK